MVYGLVSCDSCDGCGKVTNNLYRIPWSWHTREMRDVDDKPLFDEVTPVVCNKCKGSGRIPKKYYNPFNRKKKKH